MGGQIGVQSRRGKGSVFWLELELENATTKGPRSGPVMLKNQKILVVDDNLSQRELMSAILSHWRVDHQTASNGSRAVQMMKQAIDAATPYTIAIIDQQMPGMSGLELGALIRNDPELSQIHTVLHCSQGDLDREAASVADFTGYLTKPLNQNKLHALLLEISQLNQGERQASLISTTSDKQEDYKSTHVLVVEDNTVNQMVAKANLEKLGIAADIANNGQEAVEAARTIAYDLIFMDCQMPVLDGYEATRAIRILPDEAGAAVPIIAMTANAMQGDRERCLEAGMDDYLSKPTTPDKLESTLRRWLRKPDNKASDVATTATKDTTGGGSMSVPVFDPSTLDAQVMGDVQLVQAIIIAFMQELPEQLTQLQQAIHSDDIEAGARHAHKIKGTCLTTGAMELSQLALEIEQACKQGDSEKALQLLPETERQYSSLKKRLELDFPLLCEESEA